MREKYWLLWWWVCGVVPFGLVVQDIGDIPPIASFFGIGLMLGYVAGWQASIEKQIQDSRANRERDD